VLQRRFLVGPRSLGPVKPLECALSELRWGSSYMKQIIKTEKKNCQIDADLELQMNSLAHGFSNLRMSTSKITACLHCSSNTTTTTSTTSNSTTR
jgi:hypothetical protein